MKGIINFHTVLKKIIIAVRGVKKLNFLFKVLSGYFPTPPF